MNERSTRHCNLDGGVLIVLKNKKVHAEICLGIIENRQMKIMSNSAAFKTVIETLVVSGRTSGLHSASNNSSQQVFVLIAVRHLGLRNRPLFILSSRELFEFVDLSSLDYFVLKSQCGQNKTI